MTTITNPEQVVNNQTDATPEEKAGLLDMGYASPDQGEVEGYRDRLVVSRPEETIASDKDKLAKMSSDLEAAKTQAEGIQAELKKKQEEATKTDTTGGLTKADKTELGIEGEEVIPQDVLDLAYGDEDYARQIMNDPLLRAQLEHMKSKEDRLRNDLATLNAGTVDPATQAVINRIQETFERRIKQQEDINRSNLAFEKTRMLRGGTAQYAGSIAQGIVSGKEQQGLSKILELENQRNALIAEATALDKKERNDLVNEKLAEIDSIEEEKIKRLSEMNKLMIDEENKSIEKYNKAAKQSNIASLIQEGTEDPFDILNKLNLDENGELIEDPYTLDEVMEVLDALKEPDDSKTGTSYAEYLAEVDAGNFTGSFIEYKGAIADETRAPSKSDTDKTTKANDFQVAEDFVKDNPNASRVELEKELLKRTDLSKAEITSILDSAGVTAQEMTFTDSQISDIAIALVKTFTELFDTGEIKRAKELVETGQIKIGGDIVQLTNQQKEDIIAKIDEEYPDGRTTTQRILPAGK